MATKLLTDRKIASLKAADSEYLVLDGDGLYVRVRPNGTTRGNQSWLLIYPRPGGKRGKIVLGKVDDHSLKAARDWASEQRALLDHGMDPQTARKAKADCETAKQAKTLGALLDAYVNHLSKQGKSSASDVEGIFRLHIPSRLKEEPAADIHHEELVKAIRKLTELGHGRTAAKLRSYLHAAFKRALEAAEDPQTASDLIGFGLDANPVARIKTLPEYSRAGERALTRTELHEFIQRVEKLRPTVTRESLRLVLLLGGQRLTQLVQAEPDQDVDGTPVIILRDPKGKRTQPRKHVLPLVGKSLAIVDGGVHDIFVPRNATAAKTRLQNVSKKVLEIAREMVKDGVSPSPFRFGDIRRTAETHLAKLRVSKDIRSQLQSHGLSGVQDRHYDRYDYMEEKAKVLVRWETYLYATPHSRS
ncbi:MAG: integrase family protein [Burkholderiales bacterium]|nr:integrase family protein [Burkholderiales bacterium]